MKRATLRLNLDEATEYSMRAEVCLLCFDHIFDHICRTIQSLSKSHFRHFSIISNFMSFWRRTFQRSQIQVDEKPEGKVIYPNVNIKLPGRDPITLNGNIAYKFPSSVNFNLRMVELFSTPVKMTGKMNSFL